MNKRTFTADEINRLLNYLTGDDDEVNIGGGLVAVRSARKDGPGFMLNEKRIEDCAPAELEPVQTFIDEQAKQFIPTAEEVDRLLTPDALRDPGPDPDPLVPDELRDKPEPENLEPDRLGLTPDNLRAIVLDPGLARRLHDGTATAEERTDALLTPDAYREKGE